MSVLLNVLSNAAIGLEGSIGISATLATPIGGGRHGPDSWLGYFGNAGGSIGPVGVKVFGSSSWGGVEVSIPGLSIGAGGSYYGEWFRYFTGSKSSSSLI